MNAFAKVNHPNPELFNTVATATTRIIDTFNAPDLANTLNAFAKENYPNLELFNTVASAAIPIIHTFKVLLRMENILWSTISERCLVELCYALKKLGTLI